jgi:hypothetical protein
MAHLEQTDAALGLLERTVAGGFYCYPAMARDPWLDSLSQNAKFTALLARVEEQHRAAAEAFDQMDGNRMLEINRRAA